jgi:hypothetical protein
MQPARSNNWWLTTSVSAGFSRKVGMKSLLQSMEFSWYRGGLA